MKRTSAQAGVGLIEVLVALAVFAIGIMGTFAMQVAAKRTSYQAAQQSIAVNLARDILTRIRSNPAEIASYIVEGAGANVSSISTDCRLERCTNTELAAYDISQWVALMLGSAETVTIDGEELPTGGLLTPRACIRNNFGEVSVAIVWEGVNKLASGDAPKCGASSGLYGPGDEQRRSLVMTTYIGSV